MLRASAGWSILLVTSIGISSAAAQPDSKTQAWRTDYLQAKTESQRLRKPLLLHFYADWCGPCRLMERQVLNSPILFAQIGDRFVTVKVNADRHEELVERYGVKSLPSDVFIDPDGRVLAHSEGALDLRNYLAQIARVDSRFLQSQKVQVAKGRQPPAENPPVDETANDERIGGLATDADEDTQTSKSAFVESDAAFDGIVVPRPGTVLGLEGYSPVTLWDRRQWEKGSEEFAWEYKEIVYLMASLREFRKFRDDPSRYAPRLLGCDPVVLWETDRAVPGSPRFGAYYKRELFLFVSSESRARFRKNPPRYVHTRHVFRSDRPEGTTLR